VSLVIRDCPCDFQLAIAVATQTVSHQLIANCWEYKELILDVDATEIEAERQYVQ
jgi:hypothetical protein